MHISSKQLSPKFENSIVAQLATLLADLKKPSEVQAFLKDFLTPSELVVLSKRLGILWELHQGHSYQEIKENYQVSSATIATLADHPRRPGIMTALASLKLDDWADNLAKRLMKLPGLGKK